jgi:hypothetical protein
MPSIVRSDAAARLPLIVVIGIQSSSKEVVRCVTVHTMRRIHLLAKTLLRYVAPFTAGQPDAYTDPQVAAL